jgi:hypothetical protein
VFGQCQVEAEQLLYACTDNEKKECNREAVCNWNVDAQECTAKQAPLLEMLLGDSHPATAAAKGCHEFHTAAACAEAGTIEYDPAVDGRALFVSIPEPVAQKH